MSAATEVTAPETTPDVVHMVLFDGDVHVYGQADGDKALALHTVNIGANLDGAIRTNMPLATWERFRGGLPKGIKVIDHRNS